MTTKTNCVVAGDYAGTPILWDGAVLVISGFMKSKSCLDKSSIQDYSIVQSSKGGIFRHSSYMVEVNFIDGKRSLICFGENYYKRFIISMF